MILHLKNSIALSDCEKIVEAALAHAASCQFLPMAVTVLDSGGHTVVSKRQDGCGILRLDVAMAKAWGALGMGMPARKINERLAGNMPFLTGLIAASDGRMAPNAGGVLILDASRQVIGAVGLSGDTGDNDELCAIAGIEAAGFAAGA
jgi:uncharacterized protein GlcG (DUF336 family)